VEIPWVHLPGPQGFEFDRQAGQRWKATTSQEHAIVVEKPINNPGTPIDGHLALSRCNERQDALLNRRCADAGLAVLAVCEPAH
jgi:hypothetical protein